MTLGVLDAPPGKSLHPFLLLLMADLQFDSNSLLLFFWTFSSLISFTRQCHFPPDAFRGQTKQYRVITGNQLSVKSRPSRFQNLGNHPRRETTVINAGPIQINLVVFILSFSQWVGFGGYFWDETRLKFVMTSKEALRLKRKCRYISFSSSCGDDVPFPRRGMSSLSIVSIDSMLIFTQKSKVLRGEERTKWLCSLG